MREANFRSVVSNRASLCISTTLYDRRALDCTSDRPLINSLNHLAFLTSSSTRVRETLCFDGGVERLVSVLKGCQVTDTQRPDAAALVAWKWSLALQCIFFLATRGSEQVRVRVVESGAVEVIATILDNYLRLTTGCRKQQHPKVCESSGSPIEAQHPQPEAQAEAQLDGDNDTTMSGTLAPFIASPQDSSSATDVSTGEPMAIDTRSDWSTPPTAPSAVAAAVASRMERFFTQFGLRLDATSQSLVMSAAVPSPRAFRGQTLIPRDEDVIWSLEILGFLSKYASLRPYLQSTRLVLKLSVQDTQDDESACGQGSQQRCENNQSVQDYDYDSYDFENAWDVDAESLAPELNVFPLVEQYTACQQPHELPYWAGIIMRNSCRKDEARGGVRQCANLECGKWEEYPRHFAKCRRCKRTKYCSKACQLTAWSYHRYWCTPSTAAPTHSSCSSRSRTSRQQSASGAPTQTAEPESAAIAEPGRSGGESVASRIRAPASIGPLAETF